MYDGPQDESQAVHQDVVFAARNLLAGIVAPLRSSHFCSLDPRGVEDGRRRVAVSPRCFATVASQAVVDPLPGAFTPPEAQIVRDALAVGILPGQQRPRAAPPHHIENRIQNHAHIELSRSPPGLGRGDKRFDKIPFSVGQITGVELVAHASERTKPTDPFSDAL
jgi:hypothetical protein